MSEIQKWITMGTYCACYLSHSFLRPFPWSMPVLRRSTPCSRCFSIRWCYLISVPMCPSSSNHCYTAEFSNNCLFHAIFMPNYTFDWGTPGFPEVHPGTPDMCKSCPWSKFCEAISLLTIILMLWNFDIQHLWYISSWSLTFMSFGTKDLM